MFFSDAANDTANDAAFYAANYALNFLRILRILRNREPPYP
jgi:hypothetical protein